jgi:hypothetical protein
MSLKPSAVLSERPLALVAGNGMHRAVLLAWLVGLVGAMPLSAQEAPVPWDAALPSCPNGQADPVAAPASPSEVPTATCDEVGPAEPLPWQTAWGLVGVRIFMAGPKVAPNGQEYHPSFSLDLDFNYWVWRTQGLYVFADIRFWNERPEYGVTNGKDSGALGFSKRQFDLVGGAAWNYLGPWEARADAYTFNNLNRGLDFVHPAGLNDGFGLENRYYLSKEYAKLGHTGFDVARADFLSVGYYLTKTMVGNDGQTFKPGLLLRANLTHDLGNWPAYAFGDVTYLSERSLHAKLLLFDVGLAARPFRCWPRLSAWRDWEIRLGVENTADFQVGDVQNLWYAAIRVIY